MLQNVGLLVPILSGVIQREYYYFKVHLLRQNEHGNTINYVNI